MSVESEIQNFDWGTAAFCRESAFRWFQTFGVVVCPLSCGVGMVVAKLMSHVEDFLFFFFKLLPLLFFHVCHLPF